MTSSPPITCVAEDDHTAILTIDHPPANTLSHEVLEELEKVLDQANSDKAFKAVVLTSRSPKFFAAGADIKELAAIQSQKLGREFSERGQGILNKIETARKPFIAAVEGYCLGGGCELALACHLRIAGAEARFGLPEINLGLLPGFGGTQRLPQLVGPARALEMMLTGREVSAEEAYKMGLVNRVVKEGSALETALTLAKQIHSKSAVSIAAILSAAHNRDCLPMEKRFQREAEIFGSLFETHDGREGLNAFLEKRVPQFKDR